MYEFDVTDASQWRTCVSEPAETIATCFLAGQPIPDSHVQQYACVVADKSISSEHRHLFEGKSIRCLLQLHVI